MSKLEEKFEQLLLDYCTKRQTEVMSPKVKEITEQECIGFLEWYQKTRVMTDRFIIQKTHKELFQLYQKSKENEPTV